MSGRLHTRGEFYKYATHATALRVIQSNSFQWSSPTLFNDPFDHQTGFVFENDQERFASLLTASTERLIFGDSFHQVPATSLIVQMILKMRAIRDRLPRDEVMQSVREGSIEVARTLPKKLGELNARLQDFLCNSRVFCVSETLDNVVMWSHYAEKHRGVVFKLRCDDALDNRLLAARKVDYADSFVSLGSAEEYAKHLTGEAPFDLTPLIWKLAFTKHRDWAYEREWRVHIPLLDQQAGEGYSIYSEDPSIFEAVYLGSRMTPQNIELLRQEAEKFLPSMKIFLATRSATAFALNFERLNGV